MANKNKETITLIPGLATLAITVAILAATYNPNPSSDAGQHNPYMSFNASRYEIGGEND